MKKYVLCVFLILEIIYSCINFVYAMKLRIDGYSTVGVSQHFIKDQKFIMPITGIEKIVDVTYGLRRMRSHLLFDHDTLSGLKFYADINKNLSASLQFLATGYDNFDVKVDWAYIKYKFDNNWILKVGKMRIPLYLYSDIIDVGYAYPWLKPPSIVYDRVAIKNHTGLEVSYLNTWHNDWHYYISGFVSGESGHSTYPSINGEFNLFGLNLLLERDNFKFRFGYTGGNISLDLHSFSSILSFLQSYANSPCAAITSLGLSSGSCASNADDPALAQDMLFKDRFSSFFEIGSEYRYGKKWIFIGELTKRNSKSRILANILSGYITSGYYVKPNLLSYLTYGRSHTTDKRVRIINNPDWLPRVQSEFNRGLALANSDQETYSLGLRYDPIVGLDIKLEYTLVNLLHGTSGLFSIFPGKRYASLVGASIDIVF